MIIIPNEKIMNYIALDENGQWIHDPNMPEELLEEFEQFVQAEAVSRAKGLPE